MNGILEMKGFHEAFHQLYYSSDEEDSVHQYLSNDTVATGTLNNTHVLDNSTQCSSGNGAGSDILIVSFSMAHAFLMVQSQGCLHQLTPWWLHHLLNYLVANLIVLSCYSNVPSSNNLLFRV